MPRGRKPQLKVGDAVTLASDSNKKGVIVHISSEGNLSFEQGKPYNVHFHPTGAGNFSKEELFKTKPNSPSLKDETE